MFEFFLLSAKIFERSNLVMTMGKKSKSKLVKLCQRRWNDIAMLISFVLSGSIMMLVFSMV